MTRHSVAVEKEEYECTGTCRYTSSLLRRRALLAWRACPYRSPYVTWKDGQTDGHTVHTVLTHTFAVRIQRAPWSSIYLHYHHRRVREDNFLISTAAAISFRAPPTAEPTQFRISSLLLASLLLLL